MPARSDPPAYTEAVVKQAIDSYDDMGRAATLAFYNSRESVDVEWYVFILDENGGIIAHATIPDLLG